jgi:hypothetical protein
VLLAGIPLPPVTAAASFQPSAANFYRSLTKARSLETVYVMPREAEPSLNEKNFVLQALKENLRLDNRKLHDYRDLDLQFGDDNGVVEVSLGNTK